MGGRAGGGARGGGGAGRGAAQRTSLKQWDNMTVSEQLKTLTNAALGNFTESAMRKYKSLVKAGYNDYTSAYLVAKYGKSYKQLQKNGLKSPSVVNNNDPNALKSAFASALVSLDIQW